MHGAAQALRLHVQPVLRTIVVTLVLLLTSGSLAAAWEVTRFVAYEGPAIDDEGIALRDQVIGMFTSSWREQEEGSETPDFPPQLLREIEIFLETVAIEYSDMGFADPVAAGWLDSVVQDKNGQKAIRFYIYESSNPFSPQAWYKNGKECGDDTTRKVFVINTAKFAPSDENGKRTVRGVDWATLAHELMHPILLSSRFMKGRCKVGGWISEGIPDAVSFDLTRSILPTDFMAALEPGIDSRILKIFGIRNYAHPLEGHIHGADATSDEAINTNYPTSSFWRYLAETKYQKKNDPNSPYPSSRASLALGTSEVDYSYVVDLFNQDHPYSPEPLKANPKGDIRWLNEFLKSEKHIKSNLQRMYARFISAFAYYHVDRIGVAREVYGWSGPSMETWTKTVFDGCHQAGAGIGSESGAFVDVLVMPNAATCIQAYPEFGPMPPGTAVRIQTIADRHTLKQLRIGLPDGSIVSGPEIYSLYGEQDPYIGMWTLPLSAVKENTYILVNMSLQPHLSKVFHGELYLSLGTWESDLTTVPVPAAASPEKKSDGWRPTKREQLKKIREQALADPINNLLPMPSVKRSGYNKPVNCDPQRLHLNMCGPQLNIELMLTPFGYAASVRGTGAMELFQDMAGFDGTNPMIAMQEKFATMLDLERQLEARDGDSISISIPKIDYGFSGSFNNAVIKVDKAKDPQRDNSQYYIAIGPPVPRATGPGDITRPPSGKVTIDEYSHLVLRGSFSAGLVDDGDFSSENPVPVKTVSGTFNIPSPYEGDEDFELLEDHFETEMIQSSLEMMPTGHAPMQELIREAGAPPAVFCQKLDEFQLRAMGMEEACLGVNGGDGGVLPQCSCDCDARPVEEPQAACQSQCRNDWKKCPIPDDQLGEGLAAEVAHYRSLLKAGGMPPEVQEGLVEAFKKMPKWQRDLTIQGFK